MKSLPVSQAREEFAGLIEASTQGPVEITKHGRVVAVMLSPEHHRRLEEAAEQMDDVEAFDQALADESPLIPWEDVKADLGLQ